MKKNYLLTMPVALLALTASAATEPNDTVVVEKPDMVTIVTNDSLQAISVEGSKDNPNYTYKSKIELTDSNYTSESAINSKDFSFRFGLPKRDIDHTRELIGTANWYGGGTAAPGLPYAAELQSGQCGELWFVPLNLEYSPWKKGIHTFSLGIGLDWRSYGLTHEHRWVKQDGQLSFVETPSENYRQKYSRLMMFSVNFPLLYNFTPTRDFRFSLGPVFNFNTYSSIKTQWKDGSGAKHKETMKNVYVRPFTIDIMVAMRCPFFGVYFKYTPYNVLKDGQGLKFHSVSLGLYL